MGDVVPFSSTLPDRQWSWRDRHGGLHRPAEMETRHLFNTLRMIWNNTMPAHMRVGAVRLYIFGRHYTDRYLASAIGQIGRELLGRHDMTVRQKAEIAAMEAWLRRDRRNDAIARGADPARLSRTSGEQP